MKVTKIDFAKASVHIEWKHNGCSYESMLYRHSDDYSWHWDPDTRALTPKMKNDLQVAMMAELAAKVNARAKTEKYLRNNHSVAVWFADRQ